MLTPERSIEIQGLLGSDIQMQLDECVKLPAADEEPERAMRAVPALGRALPGAPSATQPGKAMFGIVQGGAVERLRIEREGLRRYGPQGLRHRRPGGGRAPGR